MNFLEQLLEKLRVLARKAQERAQARYEALNLTPEQRERLKVAGYVSFTVFFTVLFIWAQLPGKAIATAVSTKLSGIVGREVSADDVSLYRLSGLEFDNLKLRMGGGYYAEIPWQAVRVAILPLITGKKDVTLRSRTDGGEGEIRLQQSEEALEFTGDFDNLDIHSFFPAEPAQSVGLPSFVSGNLSYTAPGIPGLSGPALLARLLDPTGITAKADLTLKDGRLQGLSAGGFPLPALHFDVFHVAVDVSKEGRLGIKEMRLSGSDGSLEVTGSVTLMAPVDRSRLALQLRLVPDGELKKQVGLFLPTQMTPEADGAFKAFLKGTLGTPQIQK